MRGAYYNDNDPACVARLADLMRAGLIPEGDIDERSICDVSADDLSGYAQCHLFAGFAGWSLALDLAGWDPARPVWTISCPCPPFSSAGKQFVCPECATANPVPCPRRTGTFICCGCGHAWFADARHLWPEAWRLIAERRPRTIFGEQVAGAAGRLWFAGVRASLEILAYGAWAPDLPASCVGTFHIRQRIYWLADTERDGTERHARKHAGTPARTEGTDGRASRSGAALGRGGSPRGMADADGTGVERRAEPTVDQPDDRTDQGTADRMGQSDRNGSSPRKPAAATARHGNSADAAGRADRRVDDAAASRFAGQGQRRTVGAPRDETRVREPAGRGASDGLAHADRDAAVPGRTPNDTGKCATEDRTRTHAEPRRRGTVRDGRGMGESDDPRLQGHGRNGGGSAEPGRVPAEPERSPAAPSVPADRVGNATADGCGTERIPDDRERRTRSGEEIGQQRPWDGCVLIGTSDGKVRPVPHPESGVFPLAYGLPLGVGHVSRKQRRLAAMAGLDGASLRRAKNFRITSLRGYGNAIVPQVAAVVIETYMDANR